MKPAYSAGQCVADRVRQVDDRCAGLDRGPADLRGEGRIGTGCVLARELDLVDHRGCVFDRPAGVLHDLLRLEAELLLHVERARCEEDVDARAAGARERLRGGIEVCQHGPCERGDGRPPDRPCDRADAFEIARGCAREPGLDDVHPEPLELLGDLRLLVRLQGDARRLLTVAQRRIEDLDPASGHEHFLLGLGAKTHLWCVKSASAPTKGACSCAPPRGGESR